MTKEERLDRGVRASRLLEHEDFREVFRYLQMQAFVDFEDCVEDARLLKIKAASDGIRRVSETLKSWKLDADLIQKNL